MTDASAGIDVPAPKRAPERTGADGEQPGILVPFVAGCDAYEWGLLAALSRSGEGATASSANAICQQLAEFLVTVVSPFEAARCIDAALALLRAPDLFFPGALDRVDGFLRRLRSEADALRLVGESDLTGYYEQFLSRLSYASAAWLRIAPKEADKIAFVDRQLAETMRQRLVAKADTARKEAFSILHFCAGLADPNVGADADARAAMLTQIAAANESAFARDVEDQKETQNAILGWANRMAGAGDPAVTLMTMFGMNQKTQELADSVHTLEIAPRRLAATLLLARGTMPVSPTALELLGREPRLDRTPETAEEALRDPTSKTLEALHAGRLGPPNEVAAAYLTRGRRIAAPQMAAVGVPSSPTAGTSVTCRPEEERR